MCTCYIYPYSAFHHKTEFSRTFQLLFMFQCNEHVEINKILYSLACTWTAIINCRFYIYIIDSLILDVLLEWKLTWWLPGCNHGYSFP